MELLEKVEQSGKWPQQACTTIFFLMPKNCAHANVHSLVGSPERAPVVAKWQQKYLIDWDATDGRNGGVQQTVWEILLETLKY